MTSAHFGKDWHSKARASSSSYTKTMAEAQKTRETLTALQQELRPDDATMSLDATLSSVMLEVFNKRVEHGVLIATASPAKAGGGGMSQLSNLAEDVPGSTLKSVKVNITGTYQTYPGLLAYLKGLQKQPVAIVHLKVQEQSFEAAIRVYGSMSKS